MRTFICTFILISLTMFGCVEADEAVGYAIRSHPECLEHHALSHHYGNSSENSQSQTEVSMICNGQPKSITVKCMFGFGILSSTTCHENN